MHSGLCTAVRQARLDVRPYPFAFRIAAGALLLFACYRFEWWFLRSATVDALMASAHAFGMGLERASLDVVELGGERFRLLVGCTLIDFFCAVIPFLWETTHSTARNILRMIASFVGLFCFNVGRQLACLLAYGSGAPWWFAHEVPAGATDFLIVYLAVTSWRRRARLRVVRPLRTLNTSSSLGNCVSPLSNVIEPTARVTKGRMRIRARQVPVTGGSWQSMVTSFRVIG